MTASLSDNSDLPSVRDPAASLPSPSGPTADVEAARLLIAGALQQAGCPAGAEESLFELALRLTTLFSESHAKSTALHKLLHPGQN